MSSLGAPQQLKQQSRKGKKAWRKNVDVTEVQEGLDEYREEVRAGGPLKEKAAEELFALDTVGSKEISKKYDLGKPLRVDQILAHRSAVPAVDGRKRAGQELPNGIYESASKRRKGDWVSKQDVQRLKKTINTTSHLQDNNGPEEQQNFDLWDLTPVSTPADNLEYVPQPRKKVAPPTIRKAPLPLTANGKPVRPVQQPKAGSSYNPDFDEWNQAIIQAGDQEVEAEKKRIQEAEKETEKQARIQAAIEDDNAGRTDDESAWEGFETDNDDSQALKKKRPSRKTPAERNKATRRKEAERKAKHERKMADRKKMGDELARLLASGDMQPAEHDAALAQLEAEDSESGDDAKLRRRKRGNAAVPEKNLEVVLPEELQDSLRRLKPEGNLLQDRFRNLLVNGKLEARKPVLAPKKKKVKYTEKWSFKDFEMPVH